MVESGGELMADVIEFRNNTWMHEYMHAGGDPRDLYHGLLP